MTLSWIPSDFHGNDLAHQYASEAAKLEFIGPLPVVPISIEKVHQAVDK